MAAADLAIRLTSEDPTLKLEALRECAETGRLGAPAAEQVCDCLADKDALVRGAAANALTVCKDVAAPLAEKVAKLLVSGDAGARCAAAKVLGALASSAEPHAQAIAALLEDSEEDKTSASAIACSHGGRPKAALRLPKVAAAEALPKLGEAGRAFAATVAKLIDDNLPEVRCAAAASLGAMGAAGAAHESALLVRLETEQDPRVIASVGLALAEVGKASGTMNPEAEGHIAKMFLSQHPGVRSAAAHAVGYMGEGCTQLVGKLVKCLEDRSPQVKMAAIESIIHIGEFGQVYAVNLARLAHDQWQLPAVRAAAIEALPQLGERGAALYDDIMALIEDPEPEVQEAVWRAQEAFGAAQEEHGYWD